MLDKLLKIISSQDLLTQVVAGIVVASILVIIGCFFKNRKKNPLNKILVNNSPNANIVQAGRDIIQQDGILNKIALNKNDPIKALEDIKDIGKILDNDPNYEITTSTKDKFQALWGI